MNKKANIYFGVVVAIIVWVSGILILPYIVGDTTTFRIAMDCTNGSISDFSKLNCLAGDSIIPYFIWTLVSLAIGFILGGNQ